MAPLSRQPTFEMADHRGWRRSLIVLGSCSAPASGGRVEKTPRAHCSVPEVPEGCIGFIEELPGANSQGRTLEEVRENLREAAVMVLEANRDLARQSMDEADVVREPLRIADA
jgi:predicted RNase H-like HicB family nuclease